MDWLLPVGTTLLGVIIGLVGTYYFNVRFYRQRDELARSARFHGLEREIEANLLLVDANPLPNQAGKPRLLANALQKSQDDWFTLETTLQENLQKLYCEISIYNDHVEMVIKGTISGSDLLYQLLIKKSKDIKKLLKACQADIPSITSRDPKK